MADPAGRAELDALAAKGRDMFGTWISGWSSEEVGTFTALAGRLTGLPRAAPTGERHDV